MKTKDENIIITFLSIVVLLLAIFAVYLGDINDKKSRKIIYLEKELGKTKDLLEDYLTGETYTIKVKSGIIKWETISDVVSHKEIFQGLIVYSKLRGKLEYNNSLLGVKYQVIGINQNKSE